MGVPRLLRWINKNFPETYQTLEYSKLNKEKNYIYVGSQKIEIPLESHSSNSNLSCEVDNLFIDANVVIHSCAQKVFNYGENKRLLYRSTLTYDQKIIKLYESCFEKIIEFVELVNVKNLLYIAIDGVAPNGKMMQQRQRRFLSAKNRINSDEEVSFDSNNISVGTKFMYDFKLFLIKKLKEYISKIKTSSSKNGNSSLKINISGADVPGEGEHKAINFLRMYESYANQKNCLYSVDADLVFLTLASKSQNFYLLRDNYFDKSCMDLININMLRNNIANMFIIGKNFHDDIYKNYINDFLLIGFLVGNDFLPKIQMFLLLEDGMEFMLNIYKNNFSKQNLFLTNLKNSQISINYKQLSKFISIISKEEERFLKDQSLLNFEGKYENILMKKCINDNIFDFESYKNLYNSKIAKTSNSLKENNLKSFVDQLCLEYIQGIDWVFYYYITGCKSFQWNYRHYYAPLMSDLSNYLSSCLEQDNELKFEYNEKELIPHEQFQQLITIMPYKSKDLVPKYLQEYLDKDLNFDIDFEGKTSEHQAICLLPIIKYKDQEKKYKEIQCSAIQQKNNEYNKIGKVIFLRNKNNKVYSDFVI